MTADPAVILRQRFSAAIAKAFPAHAGADPAIAASRNTKFGEFQCNAAMALGKLLGQNPRDVALRLVESVDLADIASQPTAASVAGPGFINITLKAEALSALVESIDTPDIGLPPVSGMSRQTVVVDLCGVNLAKQMHVGHLRSTVIGDTLARVLARVGHNVLRQNHVGDWGLPIAMVTARLKAEADAGRIDLAKVTLDDLNTAYREAQRECDTGYDAVAEAAALGMGPKLLAELEAVEDPARDKAIARFQAARQTLVALQSHEPAVQAIWQRIADVTMAACLSVCKRLNAVVLPEHSAGESSYAQELAGVVEDLRRREIAVESEGALVVRLEDVGISQPLLVRKSDGAFLYATTDMAGVRRRVQKFNASRVVYAVDARQGLHFKQVFAAAHKAGYDIVPGNGPASLEHAAFGTILGDDGKPFKTRSGENVKLTDLLDEATQRAGAEVASKNPDLSEIDRARVAEAVAVAAVRYADLSTERTKDYVFAFDRMLAFEGNTGPYLLYALVRIRRIFVEAANRFGPGAAEVGGHPIVLGQPAEKSLALALTRYGSVVEDVSRTLEPHRLCAFLYEVAGCFSTFYDQCHVLGAPDQPTRASRLRICRVAERVLAEGLTLLGIPLLDRM